MLINTDAEPDTTAAGFTSLYNGRNLEGWTVRGGFCTFEAKDGYIEGNCVPKSKNTFLSTNREDYADFLFTCELKWLSDNNSGVMVRALRKTAKDREIVYGPQVEMEGTAGVRGWSGGIYGESCGGWYYPLWLEEHDRVRKAIKKDEWNRVTVLVKGNVIKTWLNGVPAANWVNDEYKKGFIALQVHQGSQGTILFRNIKIREL